MTLVNKTGGTIDGTGTHALTIDTGANTVTNAGLIEVDGAMRTGVKGIYGPGTPIPASAKDVLEQIRRSVAAH